jgi:hypothetical protein
LLELIVFAAGILDFVVNGGVAEVLAGWIVARDRI